MNKIINYCILQTGILNGVDVYYLVYRKYYTIVTKTLLSHR